jgi:uncharacterized membrane protein
MLYTLRLATVSLATRLRALHLVLYLRIVVLRLLTATTPALSSSIMPAIFSISLPIYLLAEKKPLQPNIILNSWLPLTIILSSVITLIMEYLPQKNFVLAAFSRTSASNFVVLTPTIRTGLLSVIFAQSPNELDLCSSMP